MSEFFRFLRFVVSDAKQRDEACVQPASSTGPEVSNWRSPRRVHRNTGNANKKLQRYQE